ncbi:hypothetical protein H9Q72_004160 [Fusarium xylarioides]|uniref:F-box domain-containing protein n=1 Tax=Fusarium xylarioides TaxID=221167 RepID=A0A9P7I2W0_9HYPO|nr:hypothetical protein H9Q72_004160 [Fusarium xylarioides]
MEKTCPNLSDSKTYTKQNICDNTLDDAQLATRCPLDKGRFTDASNPPRYSAGQLDQLPAELLIQVLLYIDIPSLTRFRRVNRRAMELIDSIPQYDAIIKHCPNVIRAILSIQADAFDCDVLYTTLSTTRCSTCERFGDHLYLIDCRRVCYFCFTRRLEYFPLTIGRASSFFTHGTQQRSAITSRQRLRAANPPNILSLPGRYCTSWNSEGGSSVRKRLQLFDRQAVTQDLTGSGLPKLDKTTREPQRFMAIITAPFLFDSGRQADWGCFCLGCKDETEEKTKHFRIKYTREEVSEHIARYGPVREMPRIPAPGTFCGAEEDCTFEPTLLGELLPSFPTGDWNQGFVARNPEAGKATFVRTETVQLAGIKNCWHPVKLNELEFTRQERVRRRVHVSIHPEVEGGKPVLIKLAAWPWEIPSIEVETAAYQWISGSEIGPKFLGYLTEGKDGRVVGFVAEWVEGARAAGPADIDDCKKALGRLHELGIKLGDINKNNFLVRDGYDVVLVDFGMAKRDCSPLELEDEMSTLKSSLEETSFRGGAEPAYE